MHDLNQRGDGLAWKFEFQMYMSLSTFLAFRNPVLKFLNFLNSRVLLSYKPLIKKNVNVYSSLKFGIFNNALLFLVDFCCWFIWKKFLKLLRMSPLKACPCSHQCSGLDNRFWWFNVWFMACSYWICLLCNTYEWVWPSICRGWSRRLQSCVALFTGRSQFIACFLKAVFEVWVHI